MSAEQKQYADLVRHRELNALRRLMVQRQTVAVPSQTPLTTVQESSFHATHTLEKIASIEAQMEQRLYERSAQHIAPQTPFAETQVLATQSVSLNASNTLVQTSQAQLAQMQLGQGSIAQAARLFASGNTTTAQQLLEQAISAAGTHYDHVPTWLALLDLYRATNQAAAFDARSLDFSIRFGRSTPAWVSLLDPFEATEPSQAGLPITQDCDWRAPALVSQTSLTQLFTALQSASAQRQPFSMDWRGLQTIEPMAWRTLVQTLNGLATLPITCTVYGVDTLMHSFPEHNLDAVLAQLAWLRCQNLAQAFEDKAIEFCTLHEVSPPDWKAPQCTITVATNMLVASDSPAKTSPLLAQQPELRGEIMGQLPTIHGIPTPQAGIQQDLTLQCDRLVRIDEVAVGQLKQWTLAHKAAGCRVVFQDVHRLIAAFFLLQGLYEHARINIRKD